MGVFEIKEGEFYMIQQKEGCVFAINAGGFFLYKRKSGI